MQAVAPVRLAFKTELLRATRGVIDVRDARASCDAQIKGLTLGHVGAQTT